jgi:hypothetical protein
MAENSRKIAILLLLFVLTQTITREFQIFINKKIYLPNHLVNK